MVEDSKGSDCAHFYSLSVGYGILKDLNESASSVIVGSSTFVLLMRVMGCEENKLHCFKTRAAARSGIVVINIHRMHLFTT